MLRVLIVDDEVSARIAMRVLDWQAHGCVLVGEAEDGAQALQWLQTGSVDVVMLDIGMPVMNGLELATIIARDYPQTKVIFLTMHREFDYAIEAMRLKAHDYLIKDAANPEPMWECLRRLQKENTDAPECDPDQNEALLRSRMAFAEQENLPCVRPIRMIRLSAKHCVPFSLTAIQRSLLLLPGCVDAAPLTEKEWLLFGCEDDAALLRALEAEWGKDFYVTVALEDCTNTQHAVALGRQYLCGKFYHPEQRLLTDGGYHRELPDTLSATFYAEVRSCFYDISNDVSVLNSWIVRLEKEHISPDDLKRMLISLIPISVAKEVDPSSLITALWNAETASETAALFRGYLLKARLAGGGHRIEIRRIEGYIRTHLNGNLSLQALSDYVGLSPNYLSKLFRDQMHESLKGYILRIRMETAAYMLRKSDMRINEIARTVGFPNARYFSDAFSKYYGVIPKDYRKGETK